MATDTEKKWTAQLRGTPFSLRVATADASGGVEVVPAITGQQICVQGYQFENGTVGALAGYLVHTTGTNTQIGVTENVGANSVKNSPRFEAPIAAPVGVNVGVLMAAGAVELMVWGYYS